MEFLGWLSVVVALILVTPNLSLKDFYSLPYVALLAFFVHGVLGLSLNFQTSEIWLKGVGDLRWVFLIIGLSLAWKLTLRASAERRWMIFFGIVAAAGTYGIFQFLTGIEIVRPGSDILRPVGNFWRATGFFNMPLTYASIIGMSALVIFAQLISRWKEFDHRTRTFLILCFTLALIGLLASNTRGSWLAFGLAFAVMIMVQKNNRMRLAGLSVGILGLLIVFLVPSINEMISHRFSTALNFQSTTYLERFELWRANFEMFKDHPIFGIGYGQNYRFLPEYYEQTNAHYRFISHAHNNVMQVMGGTGTIGLALYLTLCFYFLRLSYHLWRNIPKKQSLFKALSLGIFAAQIHLHGAGITECNFFDGEVTHFVAFLWSTLLAINSNHLIDQK